MKITNFKVSLSSKDLIHIFNKYIGSKGIDITSIDIDTAITVKGQYKTVLSVPFEISFQILETFNNEVIVKVFDSKVSSISVNGLTNKLLGKVAHTLDAEMDKGMMKFNIVRACNKAKPMDFTLNRMMTTKDILYVEISNLEIYT